MRKNLFVPLSTPCFYFVFWFLWNWATGLPEALHSYLYSFRILELQHICFPTLNDCSPMLTPVMKMVTRQMKAQAPKGFTISPDFNFGVDASREGLIEKRVSFQRRSVIGMTWR